MKNNKREILKEKILGNTEKAKLLEFENKMSSINEEINNSIENLNNSNESVTEALNNFTKKVRTKSPACRLDDEEVNDCVARKVPELIDEGYSQEQAVAIAESLCSVKCTDKIELPKQFVIENVEDIANAFKNALDELTMAQKKSLDAKTLENAKSLTDIIEWLKLIANKDNKVVVSKIENEVIVKLPTDAKNPIAVRLSNGKNFYDALVGGIVSGVNSDGIIEAIDTISGFDKDSNITGSIVKSGSMVTITETDGTKTLTTVIDKTDLNNKTFSEVWS